LVLREVALFIGAVRAHAACVRLLPRVDPHVRLEIGSVARAVAAELACVRLPLEYVSLVRPEMFLDCAAVSCSRGQVQHVNKGSCRRRAPRVEGGRAEERDSGDDDLPARYSQKVHANGLKETKNTHTQPRCEKGRV
jgi:hypothetical protein